MTVTLQAYLFNVFNKQIAIARRGLVPRTAPWLSPTIYDPNQAQSNPDYGAMTDRSDPRARFAWR